MAKGKSKTTSKLRSKMTKEVLTQKTEQSYKRQNNSGKFKKIWKEGEELPFWKCGEGDHIIDIIPFIAGPNHPQEKEGTPTYLLDVWVHYGIGIGENAYICPARNYGKECCICDHVNQLRKEDDPDESEIKALSPKRRAIYNIICYDSSKEEEKGVQIWDASHFLTEKNFLALARNPRGGGFTAFAHPDEGKSIAFTREGTGMTNTKYLGFKFVDRDYAISDQDLDDAYILDDLCDIPTNEELKEVFLKGSNEIEVPESDFDPEDDVPYSEDIPDPDVDDIPDPDVDDVEEDIPDMDDVPDPDMDDVEEEEDIPDIDDVEEDIPDIDDVEEEDVKPTTSRRKSANKSKGKKRTLRPPRRRE